MFLSKSDLYQSLHEEIIDEITRQDNTLIEQCISTAVAEMKPYLSPVFDTGSIFAKTGTDRDPLLVTFAADIAVYNLVSTCPVGIDMDDKRARYKRAIDWLKQVQSQEIIPDLPRASTPPAQSVIKWGSATRKETRF